MTPEKRADAAFQTGWSGLWNDPLWQDNLFTLPTYKLDGGPPVPGRFLLEPNRLFVQTQPELDPGVWRFLILQVIFHYLAGDLCGRDEDPLSWCRFSSWHAAEAVPKFDRLAVRPPWHRPFDGPVPEFRPLIELLEAGQAEPELVAALDSRMLAGPGRSSLRLATKTRDHEWAQTQSLAHQRRLVDSLREQMDQSVWALHSPGRSVSKGARAKASVAISFPLLASLIASFDLVEEAQLCRAHGIRVAAVDEGARTLYLNPDADLDPGQLRFVLAHEMLHVGLRHPVRRGGRHPQLWNLACDFVVNAWLTEMDYGLPIPGMLLDPQFDGLGVEQVYDLLARDLRRSLKLRGWGGGPGDMVDLGRTGLPGPPTGTSGWDEAFRRALLQGWEAQKALGRRGLLPSGLEEEIRALAQAPPPWDVQLADWFAVNFPTTPPVRSWARLSRRQSAAPTIPIAGRALPAEGPVKTFGLVLDTSGSMATEVLAKALGAVGNYARARKVDQVRVVCCDAEAHDLGWCSTDDLLRGIRVKGRGGTVLTPGITCLLRAADFPPTAPILVVTDGDCEGSLYLPRDHAFLVPAGAQLAFVPSGPVFKMD